MHEFDSSYFFALSRTLERTCTDLANVENRDEAMPGFFREALLEKTADIRARLKPMDLQLSLMFLDRMDFDLDDEGDETTARQFAHAVSDLSMRITDELKLTKVLQIPRERAPHYLQKDAFGVAVSNRFSDAVTDLEEASTCFALGRYTACVFHLMRVLELGCQELAKKMGVAFPVDLTWQTLLNNVRSALKALNSRATRTAAEKELYKKGSEAAAHLQNVKDAWRNDVMHPRASYTEEQALDVWNHSKPLMIKLAEFV